MLKYNRIILILYLIVPYMTKEAKCNSHQPNLHKKRSNDHSDTGNIQDLSKGFEQESIGFLPIGEIIRRANLSRFVGTPTTQKLEVNTTDETTTQFFYPNETYYPNTSINAASVLDTLLKNDVNKIRKISYKNIMEDIENINKMNLPLYKKLLIWNTIKTEKRIYEMDRRQLEVLSGLLYHIPENEFLYINTSDWDVVDFFGVSKILTRRHAAIIAYAMKRKFGDVIIQDLKFINKLKGLICGFSKSDLKNISTHTFSNIHQSVFANLWSCTYEQLVVLLETAQKPEVYGPFELWNEKIMRKIGLLVIVIKVEDFERFNYKVFNGLVPEVIDVMSNDQRYWLIENQIFKHENMMILYTNMKSKTKASLEVNNFVVLIGIYSIIITCQHKKEM